MKIFLEIKSFSKINEILKYDGKKYVICSWRLEVSNLVEVLKIWKALVVKKKC